MNFAHDSTNYIIDMLIRSTYSKGSFISEGRPTQSVPGFLDADYPFCMMIANEKDEV